MVGVAALLRHTIRMSCSHRVFAPQSSIPVRWRKRLSVPTSAYALSSLLYTVFGLVVVLQCLVCPEASLPGWPARLGLFEAGAVMIQGVLSYLSDVVFVGLVSPACLERHRATQRETPTSRWLNRRAACAQVSWAHPCDRVSALSLVALQFFKVFWVLMPTFSPAEAVWFAGGLAVAIWCKVADYHAILAGDESRYERTHLLWHLSLPVTFGGHAALRWISRDDCGLYL